MSSWKGHRGPFPTRAEGLLLVLMVLLLMGHWLALAFLPSVADPLWWMAFTAFVVFLFTE